MTMDEFARRDFLTAAAAVATVAVAAPAYASGHADPGHQHAGTHIDLARSAADCLVSGDICIAHCLGEFKAGHTELAECAVRVDELTAACTALLKFAATGSRHLPTFAAATSEVCKQCEVECRKHAENHPSCAACAQACAACRKACDTAVAT